LDHVLVPVVMINGMHFKDRVVLVALGFDTDGRKQVLGIREGSTENTRVVRSLMADLIERGLDAYTPRLWVIDGGKALRRAIMEIFGASALVSYIAARSTNAATCSTTCPSICMLASGVP
jgi:transposase-like protein